MNADTKWLIFGIVLVVVLAVLFGYLNYTTTYNNTERDRIRTTAGHVGPYVGECLWNSTGDAMVLTCQFKLDPYGEE